MRVTVDRVGRIVIPKPLRDLIGIGPDSELEVSPDGASLRLDLVVESQRMIDEPDGFPRLRAISGATLTDEDVARIRDSTQR